MFGLIILLLATAAIDTLLTGAVAHWIPLLLAIYVGCLVVRSLGSDE